jgi:hypothetical protein
VNPSRPSSARQSLPKRRYGMATNCFMRSEAGFTCPENKNARRPRNRGGELILFPSQGLGYDRRDATVRLWRRKITREFASHGRMVA